MEKPLVNLQATRVKAHSSKKREEEEREREQRASMDLLCDAYSGVSDDNNDEQEEQPKRQKSSHFFSNPPKPQRRPFLPSPSLSGALHTQSLVPGRYVSKRQRASMGSLPTTALPHNSVPVSSQFTLSGTHLLPSFSDNFLLVCSY